MEDRESNVGERFIIEDLMSSSSTLKGFYVGQIVVAIEVDDVPFCVAEEDYQEDWTVDDYADAEIPFEPLCMWQELESVNEETPAAGTAEESGTNK